HGITGRPLGIKLFDFQGIVQSPQTTINAHELLKGCELKNWQFDHLVSSQQEFARWQMRVEDSKYMNLSQGYKVYTEERKQAGTSQIANINRKCRKLQREIGTVRFEWHTDQKKVFDTILEWKSAQRKQTETFDILQFDWVKQFLNQIRSTQVDGFEGVLSTLYVKDQLVAAHLGMKTKTVFHHWFPVYDQALYKYSPGSILLLKTAEAAAERGVQRIDLGKGKERYKTSLGSGSISVGEGVVELRPVHHAVRSLWFRTRERIRTSPFRSFAQYPKRVIRSFNTKNAMN
ncbi:hypothetical protein MNBD_PLANCTO02-1129, partial [hydrothermal vent metagenome]